MSDPVVTRHSDVVPNAHAFVVEAQDVDRVHLGHYGEVETPPRADRLCALCDGLEELGELLATASAVLQDEGEKLDTVRAPQQAALLVVVDFPLLADLRRVARAVSRVAESVSQLLLSHRSSGARASGTSSLCLFSLS